MTILVVAMQYKRQSFCLDTGETYTQSAKDKKIKNKGSAWWDKPRRSQVLIFP